MILAPAMALALLCIAARPIRRAVAAIASLAALAAISALVLAPSVLAATALALAIVG